MYILKIYNVNNSDFVCQRLILKLQISVLSQQNAFNTYMCYSQCMKLAVRLKANNKLYYIYRYRYIHVVTYSFAYIYICNNLKMCSNFHTQQDLKTVLVLVFYICYHSTSLMACYMFKFAFSSINIIDIWIQHTHALFHHLIASYI